MTTVPRVAASIEDLRVGMVVAYKTDGRWYGPEEVKPCLTGGVSFAWAKCMPVWILESPSPEPVRVPVELIAALRIEVMNFAPVTPEGHEILAAARAVVDAARNGTDQPCGHAKRRNLRCVDCGKYIPSDGYRTDGTDQ